MSLALEGEPDSGAVLGSGVVPGPGVVPSSGAGIAHPGQSQHSPILELGRSVPVEQLDGMGWAGLYVQGCQVSWCQGCVVP